MEEHAVMKMSQRARSAHIIYIAIRALMSASGPPLFMTSLMSASSTMCMNSTSGISSAARACKGARVEAVVWKMQTLLMAKTPSHRSRGLPHARLTP
jgi:hypothetical protein